MCERAASVLCGGTEHPRTVVRLYVVIALVRKAYFSVPVIYKGSTIIYDTVGVSVCVCVCLGLLEYRGVVCRPSHLRFVCLKL